MQSQLYVLAIWLISNEFTWGKGNIVSLLSKMSMKKTKTYRYLVTPCLHDVKLKNYDLCFVPLNLTFGQTVEISSVRFCF